MVKLFECVKKLTGFYLLLLTFLLPLKFAGLAIMAETTSYFPTELWEYIFINFPNNSFGIFSGIGLIAAVISYGYSTKNSYMIILWISLSFVSISGIFNASTLDYVYLSLGHIWGVISYILSMMLYFRNDKKNLQLFYNIITISAILTLLIGVYQYFIGFDEQIEFYQSQARSSFEVDISNKLMERRIYSTFGGCNVYAGYLLLIGGIIFLRINKFAQNFEPQKISQWCFIILTALLYLFVIANTGSRAVIAGIGGAMVLLIFLSKISGKLKISFGLLLIFLGGAGIWLTQFMGRNFASFTERLGYLRSSLIMLYNHIFLGSGWGDFMVDNQKYRFIISNEAARDPHNIFLTFGSQAGIFAMLIVMACFIVPLIITIINYRKNFNKEIGIIIFSLSAFLIHAMLDVDYQIPAIFALSGAIFASLNIENERVLSEGKYLKRFLLFLIALIGFLSFRVSLYNNKAEKIYDDFLNSINNQSIIFEVEKKYGEVEKIKSYSPFHKIKMFQYLSYYYNGKVEFLDKKALPYLLDAIKKSPERSGYYKYLSDYYFQVKNDNENGQKYLKKSFELAPYTEKL